MNVNLLTAKGEIFSSEEWNIYPRPQLKRDSFFSLNGEWIFSTPNSSEEKITVPFPPESILSGINKNLGKAPKMIYKKEFSLPEDFIKNRVILNFGAVDQITKVYLNNNFLGEHRGGYIPFSFDITDFLKDKNILKVEVTDELKNKILPYGKQRHRRGGMWYTPISGIWQSVWIESVCKKYIKALKIDTGSDFAIISADGDDGEICVKTPDGNLSFPFKNGKAIIKLENPKMWHPSSPYLYEFTLTSGEDKIDSYFALRVLEIKQIDGYKRLCLNGKPYFFHALLDQGYFSDGIYTPASPSCYEDDILEMKSLGFNTLRKHIKIEPDIFYYYCDKYGMIVFQDMVNNGSYSFLRDTALPTIGMKRLPDALLHRNKKSRKAFEESMIETVNLLYNHPCVCYWTIFNEGWGQFNGKNMYEKLKSIDTSRFIDTTSGWFFGSPSDVESIHVYFKAFKIKSSDKPVVLSEFGGYSYKPKGHAFNLKKNYGYKFFENKEDFENALEKLYNDEIIPAIKQGLCASVYTQLSDVEDETNGLVSYDRKILKVNKERMLKISEKLKI